MPRYFFDIVTNDDKKIHDLHGIPFETLEGAKADALTGVRETLIEKGSPGAFKTIEILNEKGEVLAVVPFSLSS